VFAFVVALLAYTQYWCLYLLAITFGGLCLLSVVGDHRRAARRLLGAFVVGSAAFLPWVPVFLYQREHTGTPWGTPVLPAAPVAITFLDFSGSGLQEGWLLFLLVVPLLVVGVFAPPSRTLQLVLDLRGQPRIRWFALCGVAALVLSNVLNYLAGGAWQSRYSALVFPFFVIVLARALTVFLDRRVLAVVLVAVVGLGLTAGFRNLVTQRTTAGKVASIIESGAAPGDLVVYCPDQVGPAVNRELSVDIDQVTYPEFADPERVDWVDYVKRLRRVEPREFVDEAIGRAGSGTIWYVPSPGYRTHRGVCEEISHQLSRRRRRIVRLNSNSNVFEKPGLQQYPAQPPAPDS
jgi:hypothetical protein